MPRLAHEDEKLYKVNKEGCWEWVGSLSWNGYGQLKRKGKHLRASRYFYEKYNGKMSNNVVMDHLCKNRKCVNPLHLEAVSLLENIRRGNVPKLKVEEVNNIKIMYKKGRKQKELSQLFNVNQSEISRIVNGLRWSII